MGGADRPGGHEAILVRHASGERLDNAGSPWRLVFADGRVADAGEILEADPPRRLVIKWRNEFKPELKAEGYARCVMELEPIDGAVKLTVTHSIDREQSQVHQGRLRRLAANPSNLKSLLETGEVVLCGLSRGRARLG